jgi:hypothetical protein
MNGPSARSGCAPTADRLPELALGILGGTDRAEVLAHLDRCATCREFSTAWAATVDVLPALLGEAEPPAGFETRTLERLRIDRARVPRRSIMRRLLVAAAIAAAVMITTLAVVRIVDARSSESSDAPTEIASAHMVGQSGHRAGDAFMTLGGEQYVFLDVDYGAKTGTYRIEAVDTSDRVTSLGNLTITDGQGAWAGEMPKSGTSASPAMLRVVGANGEVFCWARFGPAATAS